MDANLDIHALGSVKISHRLPRAHHNDAVAIVRQHCESGYNYNACRWVRHSSFCCFSTL